MHLTVIMNNQKNRISPHIYVTSRSPQNYVGIVLPFRAIIQNVRKVAEKRLLWSFHVSEMNFIKDQEITAHKLYFDMQNDF